MNRKQRKRLTRILLTAGAAILLAVLPVTGLLRLAAYLAVYLLIGYDVLRKALLGIRNGRVFDENFLMAVATLGAFVLAVLTKSGDYNEAIAVMLFYQIGELFQSIAVGKSRKNIAALMDLRPDHANIEKMGQLCRVDPEGVAVGSIIVVQPGEKLPLDGVVVEGSSALNTAPLTGESLPKDVTVGDSVVSGCVNLTGVLKLRTTKEFGESTAAKILELVESAASRKSKAENFISRFARVYTPAVCAAALALAVLPPVAALMLGNAPMWLTWLYRALTFLVISCPCALVISIPLTFFAGIGGAGSRGILIKGSAYLEALAQTKYLVFDKTGTLTQGSFTVEQIRSVSMPEEKLLEYAALAECASSHPISRSLQRAWGKPFDRSRVTKIRETGGHGVTAVVDGDQVAVGNEKQMAALGITVFSDTKKGTAVHVAVNGSYAGQILLRDLPKPRAAAAVKALQAQGIQKIVMLTGDSPAAAQTVAQELGISHVHSRLLPADKVERVEALLAEKENGAKLAFVGDGINDAPVLSRADIGIAMGALGSDAAIEAADVVLMDDDPMQVSRAIGIARGCMKIVYQNTVFSLGVKFLFLALCAVGITNMWFAIFADVGVMVIAVVNAIRALKIK